MFNYKILCLGNEFIEEDSLAKKVGKLLSVNYEIINLEDSFQLIEFLRSDEDFVILDVVKGLNSVQFIDISDLKGETMTSSHDVDSQFFLKLLGDPEKIKIIGIPMIGDPEKISKEVEVILSNNKT